MCVSDLKSELQSESARAGTEAVVSEPKPGLYLDFEGAQYRFTRRVDHVRNTGAGSYFFHEIRCRQRQSELANFQTGTGRHGQRTLMGTAATQSSLVARVGSPAVHA